MQITKTFLALTAALVANVAASSNFGFSCAGIHLTGSGGGVSVAAVCVNESGGDDGEQVLGLDRCLTNNNGALACQANGGAMDSCTGCSLSGTVLTCTCFQSGGGLDISSLDLMRWVSPHPGQ
ncbi:hypothetical protein AURDEDRAFT_175178 [Auricularia subglabra TFB-10046 SS5]|nr:hypothetical protein AURDEDRAFT_175178 [Auricularia subglabra TFB-10046 SS5]